MLAFFLGGAIVRQSVLLGVSLAMIATGLTATYQLTKPRPAPVPVVDTAPSVAISVVEALRGELADVRAQLAVCERRTSDLHVALTTIAATWQGGHRAHLPEPTAEGWPAWPRLGENLDSAGD